MPFSIQLVRRYLASAALVLLCLGGSGCSSLGLSTWPTQFRLLTQTKEFAAASPIPSGLPNELSKTEIPTYHLEPGDRVLIESVDLDSDIGSLGDQKIQIDGSIDLGKFGRLRVSGMSVEEVEVAVENRVATYGPPEGFNVQLIESNSAEVYVLGEVGSPAAYTINGHEHVLDAILRAGGLTSKASPCDIVLVRPTSPSRCRAVLPVCYRQITQLGDVSTNYQLQPGDRIVVGSRGFWEEVAFWKQDSGCDRCCQSCCVETEPANVQYGMRFSRSAYPSSMPNQFAPNQSMPVGASPGQTLPSGSSPSESLPSESLPNQTRLKEGPYQVPRAELIPAGSAPSQDPMSRALRSEPAGIPEIISPMAPAPMPSGQPATSQPIQPMIPHIEAESDDDIFLPPIERKNDR